MPGLNPVDDSPSRASSFSVDVITDFTSFLHLKPEWDGLVSASAIEHPFLTHGWIRLWLECFGHDRTLHIIVIREGGDVVGIAPLLLDAQRLFGFRLRTLALTWNSHVPRCDFIVREQRREIYTAIWDYLASTRRNWDLLLLPQLQDGSMVLSEFGKAAAASSFQVAVRESGALPFVPISGTWKSYIDSLPASVRSGIRGRAERLERMGTLERERLAPDSGKLAASLDEAFHIEDASARHGRFPAQRFGEASRSFYARLTETPGIRDSVRLHYLRSGDKRIAFDLSLQFKNAVYLMKGSYLPEYAEYSPLNILASINLENCFKEGIRRYDFVGMEEDWARHWRCSALSHHWMFVYSNSPRTALFHAMKFNLGPTIEEWTKLQETRASR